MNLEGTKYDAFISYRHADLDKFVAETLHKELENYKIPKQLLHEKGIQRKNIRIFRDRDELPLSSNLADPITEALKNSDYLLVICTPRLRQSEWCKREIDTFISMHGREHILAVLAEGEPAESFPEQILYKTIEDTDAAGNIITRTVKLEPLAADVRGKDFKEIKSKIKQEKLRIFAPMLDVNYDDLRQRHKEQRMKRAISISAAIAAVMLVFSTISTVMAIQIKKQADHIQEQNDKITLQSNDISKKSIEISQQSKKIQEQYEEAQTDYSRSLADASTRVLNSGDRMAALYIARKALPTNLQKPEIPYTPEAEYALSNALYNYETGTAFLPFYAYDVEAGIEYMKISKDGSKLLVVDTIGQAYIWDTATHELLLKIEGEDLNVESNAALCGENLFFYHSSDGINRYDFSTGETVCIDPDGYEVIASEDGTKILTFFLDGMRCYNTNDNTLCFEMENQGLGTIWQSDTIFSEDGSQIMLLQEQQDMTSLIIMDANTGTITGQYDLAYDYTSLYCSNQTTWIIGAQQEKIGQFTADCLCIDTKTCQLLWQRKLGTIWPSGGDCTRIENKEYLYLYNSSNVMTLDAATGDLLFQEEVDGRILNSYLLNGQEAELIMCSDGTILCYQINSGVITDASSFIEYSNQNIVDFIWTPGNVFITPKSGNQLLNYKIQQGSKQTMLAEVSYEESYGTINSDGTLLLYKASADSGCKIILKDVKTGQQRAVKKVEGENPGFCFVGDGASEFAIYDELCTIYSVQDGAEIRTIQLSEDCTFTGFSLGRAMVLASDYATGHDLAYSLESGEIVMKTPNAELKADGKKIVFDENGAKCACYDKNMDEIRLYYTDQKQPYITKKIMLGNTENIFFTDDGKYLCILNKDNCLMFYSAETLELAETLYDVNMVYLNSAEYIESLHRYILSNSMGSYILNDELKVTAYVPLCCVYNEKIKSFIIENLREFYEVPYGSFETLIQEADQLLEGYTVSEQIKTRYNVK